MIIKLEQVDDLSKLSMVELLDRSNYIMRSWMARRDITPRTLAAGKLLIHKKEVLQDKLMHKEITAKETIQVSMGMLISKIESLDTSVEVIRELKLRHFLSMFGDFLKYNCKNYREKRGRIGFPDDKCRPNTKTVDKIAAIAEQMNMV